MAAVAMARPLQPGVLFAIYLVLSGLERFLVEFVRRNDDAVAGLTAPQLESLVLMAVGAVWIAIASAAALGELQHSLPES